MNPKWAVMINRMLAQVLQTYFIKEKNDVSAKRFLPFNGFPVSVFQGFSFTLQWLSHAL